MFKHLTLESDGPIAVLTLNRPQRRNALSLELMLEFLRCLEHIEQNRAAQILIVAAAGNVFCSGHDLTELADRSEDEYRHIFDVCTQLMTRLQSIPQPVIAEVQGTATAAGCQLVASCDLAIASDQATFATPGVRIGLFCTTPMVAVSRAIGRKRALEMLFTGDPIDAATAADWGLVNRVVPRSELPAATRELARRIAAASSFTLGLGKQAFYDEAGLDQARAYEHAKAAMTRNALAADAREGITAFLGKRQACWSGK